MLKYSPIVGLMGHRQVGKTTLAETFSGDYVTFDNKSALNSATIDPNGFLSQFKKLPVVIDECQLCPDIFPALKEYVRKNPKPGQFLLTGSVRFSSRKVIRESLTGRIVNTELLPFAVSETNQIKLSSTIIKLLTHEDIFEPKPTGATYNINDFLIRGGLPGILFIRERSVRKQKFESQIETLLERDLRLIQETSLSYSTLRNLLSYCSMAQGEPLDITAISRATRISQPTIKKLLRAFEAMYLIRFIDTEGDLKRPTFYFEDAGEAAILGK